nr:PREDICTED: probable glutamate receptor [Bemisia tabaci]
MRLLIQITVTVVCCVKAEIAVDLVVDFLVDRNLSFVVLFPCSDTDYYTWLKYSSDQADYGFLTLDGSTITRKDKHDGQDMTSVEIHSSSIQTGIVVDSNCAKNVEVLNMVPRDLLFSSKYHWLILSDSEIGGVLNIDDYKPLASMPLTLESDVTIATGHEDTSRNLTDVFRFDPNGGINATLAGSWQRGSGIQWFWTQTRRDRRLNMHGLEITSGIVFVKVSNMTTTDPELWLNPNYMKGIEGLSRHAYELWTYLSDLHNFKIKIVAIVDSYGISNGTSFDGLIGLLQREEAEVSIIAIVMTEERMYAVDYVRVPRSFWGWRPMFVFLHPKTSSKITALVDAVSTNAWIGIGCMALLLYLALSASYNVSHNLLERVSLAFTFTAAVVAQQGLSQLCRDANRLSVRIVIVSALIFGFILLFFYNATILTFLLSLPTKTIRTMRQLIDSNLLIVSENAVQYIDLNLKLNVSNVKEVFTKKIRSRDHFVPFATGISKMRKEQYAFMSDDQKIFRHLQENLTDTERCAAQVIDLLPAKFPFSIPIRKESAYGEMLARGFLLLLERGIVDRVDRRWTYGQPECIMSDFMPVEIDDVFFAFLVILAGTLTSAILFFTEIISVQSLSLLSDKSKR